MNTNEHEENRHKLIHALSFKTNFHDTGTYNRSDREPNVSVSKKGIAHTNNSVSYR